MQLADEYEQCRRVLAASGSSFTLPILLLPRSKRLATAALYAFCRIADDIADGPEGGVPEPAQRRAAALELFRRGLVDSLEGRAVEGLGATASGVLRAVADTVSRYGVPDTHLFDVLDGVSQDLTPPRFERFPELEEYCRKVASAVGLAATRVWGFRSPAAVEAGQAPAHACGVAFQLTNILRDLLEDAAMGRVYLPREDLAECGVTEADLLAGRGARVERLFRLFLERAGQFYAAASGLDGLLSFDGRLAFRAMFGGYASIHRRLARCGRPTPRVRGGGRLRLAASVLAGVIGGPPRVGITGSRGRGAPRHAPGMPREAPG